MKLPRYFSAILLCAFALPGVQTPASGQNWTLNVPATVPWFDTGIDIAAGQHLNISANGLVQWATSSPGINADGIGDGWDGTLRNPGTVVPSAIWLSLIGKVGGDALDIGSGTPVPEGLLGKGSGFVGSSYSQDVLASGRLFLGFNDTTANFGDNSGAFSVSIAVVPEPSVLAILLACVPLAVLLRRRR